VGFAFASTDSLSSSRQVLHFVSTSGIEADITYHPSTGVWAAWRGYTNTFLGSGVYNIGSSGAWHWLEFHYVISGAVGVVEVWVDGNQVLNLTGVNTSQNSVTAFNTIIFINGSGGGMPNGIQGRLDDIYILNPTGAYNTTRLGDSRIETLKPSSDAGPNNGTLTSGVSHFAMVNEDQNDGGTTTITLANTSGQEELFGVSALSGAPTSVHAVKVSVIAEKSDAGACNLETVLASGSVVANGPSVGLSTTFAVIGGIQEYDPNTSAPWLYTAVNAMNFGFQVP